MEFDYSRGIFERAYRPDGWTPFWTRKRRRVRILVAAPRPILYDDPRTTVAKKNEETGEVAWNTRLISHQSISGWGKVFGDKVIATAILNLLHCSTVI